MKDFYFLVVLVLIVWHVLTLSWQNNYQMELVTQSCLKLTLAILRQESSEALRRRLYALLLSYFQYCQHMLVQDVPSTVLQFLLLDEQDGDDMDLQKVIKDATEGSELGKQMALYVLDALFCVDHEKYFLSQLPSRGFLRLNKHQQFSSGGIAHKLWIEEPENFPICLAIKPYLKSVVSAYFRKLKLC